MKNQTFEAVEYHLIVYLATIFPNVLDNLKIGDIEHDEAHLFDRYDGLYVVSPTERDRRRIIEHTMIAGILHVPREIITSAVERNRKRFESPFYEVRNLARSLYDAILKCRAIAEEGADDGK